MDFDNGHRQLQYSFVACSDIHILSENDRKLHILVENIHRLDTGTLECFLLNGDIFDFCFGASPYFAAKYSLLGETLEQLVQKGVRVVFMEGNHEFAIHKMPWKGVEFCNHRDFSLTLKDRTQIIATHGDRLMAPWHYHTYRYLTKTAVFSFFARFIPGAFLDRLALHISKKSRSYDAYRHLNLDRVKSVVSQWISQSTAQFGIIGHFHTPYQVSNPERLQTCLGAQSWDKPNFLVYDGSGFERIFLDAPDVGVTDTEAVKP